MKIKAIFALTLVVTLEVFSQGTWTTISPFPGFGRWDATSFAIKGKGYVCTGNTYGVLTNDLWEYDTLANTWAQKANFPGNPRDSAVSFVINDSLGFVGLGHDASVYCNDFYYYNPSSNTWTPIGSPFPGTLRSRAFGAGVGNIGFVLFGFYSASAPVDFWEYDFSANTWSPIAAYPGPNSWDAAGFVINQKIYAYQAAGNPNFYEYNPSNNTWTPKAYASFVLGAPCGFSLGTKGYIATGYFSGLSRDVYEYNSVTDTWMMGTPYAIPGLGTARAVSFALGSKAYLGLGDSAMIYTQSQNFWKFSPCAVPTPSITPSGQATICAGDSILLTSSAASNNQWLLNNNPINGATSQTYYASQSGQYTVTSGCSTPSSQFTLNLVPNTIAPPICMVTVDSLSQFNVIMWDKTPYNNVDSFIVYREISTNNYQRIGAVHYDSLSLFVDTVASLYFPNTGNPNSGTYRYKLKVVDTCGNAGPFGDYHNTIYITHNLGTFTWAQLYSIENGPNPVSTYVLMRDDFSTGNWQAINSVAGTQQTIVDPAYNAWQATASWRVQTFWNITCTPTLRHNGNEVAAYTTSRSNTITPSLSTPEFNNLPLISLYPVPAVDQLQIVCSGANLLRIEISDIAGRMILATETSTVDIRSLPDGAYHIKVFTDKGHVVKRFTRLH